MFCPKCGSEVLDGTEACPKCATKLTTEAPIQTQQPVTNPSLTKKKPKKWMIILIAIAALILILFVANAKKLTELGEQDQRDQEAIKAKQEALQMEKDSASQSEIESLS